MASPISALDGYHTAEHSNGYGRELAIEEVTGLQLIQVAAWADNTDSVEQRLVAELGMPGIPLPGTAVQNGDVLLARVEPLKWWILNSGVEISVPELSPTEGCLLDLSHSRTWLAISGENAGSLLNRFLPIDLRDAVFPAGSIATTAFHHTGVTVHRSADGSYNLLLLRSFAVSLWQMMHETALQFKAG